MVRRRFNLRLANSSDRASALDHRDDPAVEFRAYENGAGEVQSAVPV